LASEVYDIYIIKAGPVYELRATNRVGDVCKATPAIAHGMIIGRT
jgi:hypothetical protein